MAVREKSLSRSSSRMSAASNTLRWVGLVLRWSFHCFPSETPLRFSVPKQMNPNVCGWYRVWGTKLNHRGSATVYPLWTWLARVTCPRQLRRVSLYSAWMWFTDAGTIFTRWAAVKSDRICTAACAAQVGDVATEAPIFCRMHQANRRSSIEGGNCLCGCARACVV